MVAKVLHRTVKVLRSILLVLTRLFVGRLYGLFALFSTFRVLVLIALIFMLMLTRISLLLFGFMTDCVIMLYVALHSRPITDYKRVYERSSGASAPLPAGRAVIELQAAGLRLASARQLVAGLNDNFVTLTVCDNKLARSIKYYRALQFNSKSARGFQRGILFHVYIPL